MFEPKTICMMMLLLITSGCIHPLPPKARHAVDEGLSLAEVSRDPASFLDRELLLGGVVVSLERSEVRSLLELVEWRINRWGEPLAVDDSGRRFLVETRSPLDPRAYEPGRLVTLTGSVIGAETRRSGQDVDTYPLLHLEEIHLWETPYRYGVHPTRGDPMAPTYVGPEDIRRRHPYDPGYSAYPYTPYWYRVE